MYSSRLPNETTIIESWLSSAIHQSRGSQEPIPAREVSACLLQLYCPHSQENLFCTQPDTLALGTLTARLMMSGDAEETHAVRRWRTVSDARMCLLTSADLLPPPPRCSTRWRCTSLATSDLPLLLLPLHQEYVQCLHTITYYWFKIIILVQHSLNDKGQGTVCLVKWCHRVSNKLSEYVIGWFVRCGRAHLVTGVMTRVQPHDNLVSQPYLWQHMMPFLYSYEPYAYRLLFHLLLVDSSNDDVRKFPKPSGGIGWSVMRECGLEHLL